MTIHFRRASRSGGGAFIAKLYRGQHLLSCPAAFCNLHGTCRIFQSAWLFTSKLQGRCCHFHCNFTQCPPFSVKPQRQQNVSAQPFMLRKTKNQTINIIQILKNRIAVSLWKQRLAYYTLHLVQSPTSDIGRLTYVSQWLQSSILSQQFFFIYSVLMLDPIQCNGLIHRSTRSVILLMSIKPFAMSSFLWLSWNVEVK